MTEKFDLSKKINDYGYDDDGTPDEDVIAVRDVKEFIKRLKKRFNKPMDITHFNKIIDELAGEDLK